MTSDRKDTADNREETVVPGGDLGELWEQWCAGDERVKESLLNRAAELSPEQLVQLLIVQQQWQWQQGDRVRAETLFDQYPGLKSDRDCAVDLVYAEFLLESDAGGPPDVDKYLDRFPELRDQLRRQFDIEGCLGEGDISDAADTDLPLTFVARGDGEQPGTGRPGERPLATFGDYDLLSEIATGGMGVVYKARQRKLNRVVALKMIRSGEFAEPEQVERFYTEAKAAANLQHPHIVAIHEVGEQAGRHFYSMDFVEGQTLAEMVREHALPPQRAAAYVKTIAAAMQFAHEQGVLHRDLKPANVLVNQADEPQIADFGLAKQLDEQSQLTIEGLVIGTPNYMPPEQASGRVDDVGPASDVYSIGAILYELLTGRPPFRGENRIDTIRQVLEVEPVSPRLLNPRVPRDLDTICRKCLQKDPARRYPTAGDLADDLGRFLADQPITARPVSRTERLWRWCHRNPYLAAAVSLAAACLLVAVVSLVWGYLSTKSALATAESALATAERRLDQTRTAIDELFTLVAEETLLNKPGLQPLRKQLLSKARDLYREVLAAEGDEPRIRHDLSVSHFRYGRIMEELGSPKEALQPLHRARRMQERLHSDQPQNAELLCDLSDTWNALGSVLSSMRNYDDARPYFQQAHEARTALAEGDPESREYRRKLANVLMHLGVIDNETGDLSGARNQMQAAQEVRERLLSTDPDSENIRRDLAKGYFNLARVAIALRDRAFEEKNGPAFEENQSRARGDFARAIEEFKKLPPESPWALSDQYLLATCYHLQAHETWEPERVAEAERLYNEARTRMQSLADENPDVHLYQGDLAGILLEIGGLYAGQDKDDESLAMYEEAREILAGLVERYPEVPDYRTNLATALREIGKHHINRDRLDEASDVIYQSVEHVLRLKADSSESSVHEQDFVEVLEVLAQAYRDLGETTKAVECVDWGLRLDPDNERFRELRQRRPDSEENGDSTGSRATGRSP